MTTIKGEKAAGLVAKHIEGLILEGSLRPGESLLSERELAERLDVSRPTLRDVVESSAAAMAADRATEIDLRTLRGCLDRIDRAHAKGDPVEEADADAELHMTIYEACHNVVILQIMRVLSSNLRTDVLHNRERLFTIPFTRDLLRNQHREIGDAILGRDPEAARRAAHTHLAYLRNAAREIREAEAKLGISLRRLEGGGLASRKASR